MPEIKVKLLSKNLGYVKNINEIYQKIYCTDEEQKFPLYSITKIDGEEESIVPISENNFNIFDFKELNNISLDNYQWRLGIKFNSLTFKYFLNSNICSSNVSNFGIILF